MTSIKNTYFMLFLETKWWEMLYALCVGKRKKLWTKGPEWNNAAHEGKESINISHTQHRATLIPTPISTKVKEWGREKQMRPTPGARKSKQI